MVLADANEGVEIWVGVEAPSKEVKKLTKVARVGVKGMGRSAPLPSQVGDPLPRRLGEAGGGGEGGQITTLMSRLLSRISWAGLAGVTFSGWAL